MGNLFVVSTPIGNLADITLRALDVLKSVDFVLAEDTRRIKKLLSYYQIKKPVLSYHKYSSLNIYQKIYNLLLANKNLALVTDAGTPTICDPGAKLIEFLVDKNIKIIPIPGPSAVIVALSVSGYDASRFVFLGYPPRKKFRREFFDLIKEIKIWPIVLYEAPHRLQKTLDDLENILGGNFKLVICRELTKIYEQIWRGSIQEAKNHFQNKNLVGEFVLVLNKNKS